MPIFLALNQIKPYRVLNVYKIGLFYRPNDHGRPRWDVDFPKICTWAHFGPSAYLKQFSEYFPANNSISDDKSSRKHQTDAYISRVEIEPGWGPVLLCCCTDCHTEAHRRRQTPARYPTYEASMEYEALNVFARHQLFVLAVCSSSHSMGRGGSFSKFPPTHVLTHDINPRLAICVWSSAEIS